MKFKKVVSLMVSISLLASLVVGCGSKDVAKDTSTTTAPSTESSAGPVLDKNYAVKFAVPADGVTSNVITAQVKLAEEAGHKIEVVAIPGSGQDYNNKLNVSLMAGDEIDLIRSNTMINFVLSQAKLLTELDDVAKANGVDLEKTFGTNLVKQNDKVLGVPVTKDQWITLFNKKIFDDAKVPYPTAENWTWDKYIETAKKLTNKDKGIYGSYMLDYDSYNYMTAAQKGIPAYKEDGTSNFDAPEYKDAMKFFYSLGNEHKIQPDFLTFKSKKLQWDDFARGKYGMFVCGSWSTCLLTDAKTYPRDWKFGILPMPAVDGASKTALSIIGQYAVPSTSKHANEAFMAAYAIGSNFYKAATGDVYTNANLTDAQKSEWAKKVCESFNGEVTVDEFNAAFNGISPVSEKFIGKGANAIAQAFISEGEAFGVGQKSLDDAMKAVKDKAEQAIKADK